MKKKNIFREIKWIITLIAIVISFKAVSQNSKTDQRIIADTKTARAEFIKVDGLMKSLFNNAYGYVIFPNVGKWGLGIGGASGNGIVYEKGKMIGKARLTQVNIGFQAGGQAYREVIFFEAKKDMDKFKENKLQFSAQASAVAVTEGASGNAKYADGVMIFTQQKGGLMYEASIGGQKFRFRKF